MQGNSLNECAKSVFGLRDGSIAPMLRDISDQFSVTGQPLATTLATYCCDVGHLFIVSIGRRVGGPRCAVRKQLLWNSHWKYLSVLPFARRVPSGDGHMSLSTRWGCANSAIRASHI